MYATINRTKVELKREQYNLLPEKRRAINRTKVELKHWRAAGGGGVAGYQSYQSGIETTAARTRLFTEYNYQSYQSGIETATARRQRLRGATINRTKVELKQHPPARAYSQSIYQSYQSGIETAVELLRSRKVAVYQSYQSGIETWVDWWRNIQQLAINRTKVELKLILGTYT